VTTDGLVQAPVGKGDGGHLSGLRDWARLLRPHHWTKNLLVFAGAVFSRKLDAAHLLSAAEAFVCFCAVSSAGYVVNDLLDAARDRTHPKKCRRPIAAGRVSAPAGAAVAVALLLAGIYAGFRLGMATGTCLVLYAVNSLLYSRFLKHVAVLDVMSIAIGFVIRLVAGVFVVDAVPTAWIVLCTFFLATFLGFAKRRAELETLDGERADQRPVLRKYSVPYLDALFNESATMTVMSYALFTVTSGKNPSLVVTLPLVYYCILHYKRLVMIRREGEEPERILLKDVRIWLCVLLWLALYVWIDLGHLHLLS
jgi:4-hydroxybenzoate polyprenyltransferase